jgi:threonine aldolase
VEQLRDVPGVRLPWRTQANEVFAIIPRRIHNALRMEGASYYDWGARGLRAEDRPGPDEVFIRMVTSFATKGQEVDKLARIVKEVSQQAM